MPLITPAQKIVANIASRKEETISFVMHQLKAMFDEINTPGLQSEILAELGTSAVPEAFTPYMTLQAALASLGYAAPAANLEEFKPQANGSVIYVAPVTATI